MGQNYRGRRRVLSIYLELTTDRIFGRVPWATAGYVFSVFAGRAHDSGRESGVTAPPPSEPDGRFSRIRLSGWWGLPVRLSIGARAVFQTKQPLRRKPSVRPLFTIGFAPPVSGPF